MRFRAGFNEPWQSWTRRTGSKQRVAASGWDTVNNNFGDRLGHGIPFSLGDADGMVGVVAERTGVQAQGVWPKHRGHSCE